MISITLQYDFDVIYVVATLRDFFIYCFSFNVVKVAIINLEGIKTKRNCSDQS